MNKNLFPLLGTLLLLHSSLVFAQSKVVNVNPLTGTANIVIPVYTVQSGQVSLPVTISYSSVGVKVKDVEGTAGMGWQLNAGGQINRQVRGLPDDVSKDNVKNTMLGWMSSANTAANAIAGFTIYNNGANCSYENTDFNNITSTFLYSMDTEPDMFYVEAPGLNCQMIYDRTSAKFHPVSYQDLIINYITDPISGLISSFTIINDKGIKYVFAAGDSVTQTTMSGSHNYFATKYNQYLHGINYSDNWGLTSITDPNGNGVTLDYSFYSKRGSTDPVSIYMPGATTATLQYYIKQTVVPEIVNEIKTVNVNGVKSALTFDWGQDHGVGTGQPIIAEISNAANDWDFGYAGDVSLNNPNNPNNTDSYERLFLKSFFYNSGIGCTSIVYKFNYIGEAPGGSDVRGYDLDGLITTPLPDSTSNQLDYWGYYSTNASPNSLMPKVWISGNASGIPPYTIDNPNGNTNYPYYTSVGYIRAADPANVMDGTLNKIGYEEIMNGRPTDQIPTPPSSTNITYESNNYIDAVTGATVQGGGIRIKQIIDSVGNGSTNNIIRNYSYINPSTGYSSGRPISLPVFAFTVPYSGSATGLALWESNTVVSDYDLSSEDHTILYDYVRVSATGAGSILYHNYNPATAWDIRATPACSGCTTADWAPVVNDIARNNCSLNYGPIKNNVSSYPFIPNPNYNFERGIPLSTIDYNDAGQEVAETDYSYQRSNTPSTITAFKCENDPNGSLVTKTYNKYAVYYNTSELTATITKKTFDSPTLSQARTISTNNTYGSLYHKLLTQQSITNSDNSTFTTHISYVKDFPAAAAGVNANVNALYQLRQLNINTPIETYQQITQGGSTITTSASLALYKASTNGAITNYLPSQQLKWIQPNTSTFTPLAVTASSLTQDPNYFAISNYDTYDNTGTIITADDANKNFQTVITDHISNKPTAVFKNARYNEVAFNDFDSESAPPVNTFTIIGSGSFTPVGSHAGNAAGLTSSQSVSSGTITKNGIANNYIFSIWINAAVAGTLNFTGASISPLSYSGGWHYYEIKIPTAALSATFTLGFTTSQSISIDDILLYPDIAEASTATYDNEGYYKIAETNTNGVSAYYINDEWGRLLFKYDQDKNIVEKKSYLTSDGITNHTSYTPFITVAPSAPNIVNTVTNFEVLDYIAPNCDVTSYSWNFGDGSTAHDLNGNETHTYISTGTYHVSVVINSILGAYTASATITVTNPPPPPPPLVPSICQSGVVVWYDHGGTPQIRNTCTTPSPNTTVYQITSISGLEGSGTTFNWQVSVDGVNWYDALDAALIHANATGQGTSRLTIPCSSSSVSYSVRCSVTCSSPSQSGISNVDSFVAH